jgi:hypothetical protein
MKTIQASTLTYRINEEDADFRSLLAGIIQDHRKYLVDCVINTGLDRYVDYKFSQRLSQSEINDLKRNLSGLKNSTISLDKYSSIVESVNKYDFFQLPNVIFYNEIDQRLKENLIQTEINFNTHKKFSHDHE